MADAVQFRLEGMIPELEDLEKRGIFKANEIKSIVKKRTNFEYAMKKRATELGDYMRYIQYEISVDRLRRARKAKMGIKKKEGFSEHAIVKRVHFIFERAVQKFKGDERLWLQYVEYSAKAGGRKTLNKIFARALQFHPRSESLWTRAAHWELEENQNMTAGRVLMQRALRMNKESKTLWLNYFKLEIMYILKLIEREKDIFGEDAEGTLSLNYSGGIDLPKVEGEPEEEVQAPALPREGIRTLVAGAIPKVIYKNACLAIPDDFQFRLQFLEPCAAFDAGSDLRKVIVADILSTFAEEERCWYSYAKWILRNGAHDNLESIIGGLFDEALHACPTDKMRAIRVQFYSEWVDEVTSMAPSEDSEDARRNLLETLIRRLVDICNESQMYGDADVSLIWTETLFNIGHADKAEDVLNKALLAQSTGNGSLRLWKFKVWVETRKYCSGTGSLEAVNEAYEKAAASCASDPGIASLWRDFFNFEATRASSSKHLASLYVRAVIALKGDAHTISHDYIVCTRTMFGSKALRDAYALVFKHTTPPLAFFVKCLDGEKNQETVDADRVCTLYERACQTHGEYDDDIWLGYIAFLSAQSRFEKSTQVYYRAVKTLSESSNFIRKYQATK